MQKLKKDDVEKVFGNSTGNKITVLYRKPVKMNKKENPFYRKEGRSFVEISIVEKEIRATYEFGANYADKINEALKEKGLDGNFQTKERGWAETVIKDKLIRHKEKGNLYVKVYASDDEDNMECSYYIDGNPASPEDLETIKKFEIKKDKSIKTQESAGLEKSEQVKTFLITLDNIKEFTLDSETYTII